MKKTKITNLSDQFQNHLPKSKRGKIDTRNTQTHTFRACYRHFNTKCRT